MPTRFRHVAPNRKQESGTNMLLLRPRRPGAPSALLRWRRPVLLLAAICAAIVVYWETTSFVAYTGDST